MGISGNTLKCLCYFTHFVLKIGACSMGWKEVIWARAQLMGKKAVIFSHCTGTGQAVKSAGEPGFSKALEEDLK